MVTNPFHREHSYGAVTQAPGMTVVLALLNIVCCTVPLA
jgi:hypothetical protein